MGVFNKKTRFGQLLQVLAVFIILTVFLFLQRSGIRYETVAFESPYLPTDLAVNMKDAGDKKDCLLIVSGSEPELGDNIIELEQVLIDMRVGYETYDLEEGRFPDLYKYSTVMVAVSNLESFDEDIFTLSGWVYDGGRALFPLTLQRERTLDLVASKLGITEAGYENVRVDSIYVEEGFMIGGGMTYAVTDGYDSALSVSLSEHVKIHAYEGESGAPLIWENRYGEGKFVVDNFGLCEKAYRGFFAASYSLLEDVSVYPVINSSTFYIDDFPSPVPMGDGEFIRRDYNMDIGGFYSNIWWPDMMQLAEKYGMVYTAVMIENYESQVTGVLPRNSDQARYRYFGNMLLRMGGELGYHGYNHQPLCLEGYDYGQESGYKSWESMDVMKNSIKELESFASELFPEEVFSVYVPPSNILSDEGRQILVSEFPDIRTIASLYFSGDGAYSQEYEVGADGMIESPRVISGCVIDEYMQIAALSELNMHYVNSHFLHPDDLLDEDRGAAMGWENLKMTFERYLSWLYTSAPEIRDLNGSGIAGAIERYCALSLWKEDTPEDFYLTLDGFYDEAYLLVRVNEGTVGAVKGGRLEHITGNLYVLHARSPEIEIERNR